jgi:ABC-type iron transport system FetAB ATPase subunit
VIIWVSHDQAQIARVADRHYAVSNGMLEERTMSAGND